MMPGVLRKLPAPFHTGTTQDGDTFTLLIPGVTTGTGSGGTYANLQWDRGGQWQTNGSQENSREILYDGISRRRDSQPRTLLGWIAGRPTPSRSSRC